MEWRGSLRAAYTWWVVAAGLVSAVGGVALSLALANDDARAAALWSAALCLVVGVVLVAAAIVFGRVELAIDARGVHVVLGPWHRPRWDVPWTEVCSAGVVDVRALRWGGWGMRWRPGYGRAVVMRQGAGVEFGLVDGKVLVVTIDDADAAVAAAQQWIRQSAR